MKNLVIKTALAITLLISFSCTKKDANPTTPGCKIISFAGVSETTSPGGGSPRNFGSSSITYNADGKITSIKYIDNSKYTYEYSGNTYTQTYILATDIPQYKVVITLDANGYVSKEISNSFTNGVASAPNTYLYEYDSNGYLTKKTSQYFSVSLNTTVTSSIESYTYANGNIASSTNVSPTGTVFSNTSYEYYTNLENKGGLESSYLGVNYGKPTKNLLKKTTRTNVSSSGVFPVEYTYQVDDKGNITQSIMKSTYVTYFDTQTVNYVFECN